MTSSHFEMHFAKVLSPNDVGVTGSHQAGLLVPKNIARLSYFPALDISMLNPRKKLAFYDVVRDEFISLNFIFYNNKDLGLGTRSEYRLTGASKWFDQHHASVSDEIEFGYISKRQLAINFVQSDHPERHTVIEKDLGEMPRVIQLSGSWRVIGRLR